MISFEYTDSFRIRTAHERLRAIIEPIRLKVQSLGNPCCRLPDFRRRHEDGGDVNSRPSRIVGQRHRRSSDHEHLAPNANSSKFVVERPESHQEPVAVEEHGYA